MDVRKIEESVANLVEPVIEGFGLELVDVEYMQDGGYWFLRVYIEKEDGIGLEECEKVSRAIDEDIDELVEGKFFLEVSSPGLERPLKKEKDFVRFTGDKVNLKLKHKIEDKRRIEGRLIKFDEEEKNLYVDFKGKEVLVPFKEVEKAKLVFEFDEMD